MRYPLVRGMFRTLAGFIVVALIGLATTLAWLIYRDEAKEVVSAWVPSLGSSFTASTTKAPSNLDVTAEQTSSTAEVRASGQNTAPQSTPALAPTLGSESQLEAVLRDLAALRRSVEELAAKQDQMAQSIATIQAVQQDIRAKMSFAPPSSAVAIPPRRSEPRVAPTPRRPSATHAPSGASAIPPASPAPPQQ